MRSPQLAGLAAPAQYYDCENPPKVFRDMKMRYSYFLLWEEKERCGTGRFRLWGGANVCLPLSNESAMAETIKNAERNKKRADMVSGA
jgi:hypothetical protein